jgi:F-type H+-transporting ATPase subunit delta
MLVKNSLINSWATALENIAIQEKKTTAFVEQSNAIVDLLKDNPELVNLLSVHQQSDDIRLHIIDNIFTKKDFDERIISALKLIAKADLIFHTRDIFKLLRKKLARRSDVTFGVVWSVSELKENIIKNIEDKLSQKLNQKIKLVNKIDKTLLGGVQVIVDGQEFDGS